MNDIDRLPRARMAGAHAPDSGLPRLLALGLIMRSERGPRIDGVSFAVAGGEVVGLVGRSAAGRSALLRLVSGLLTPAHGVVSVCGTPMNDIRGASVYSGCRPPVVIVPPASTLAGPLPGTPVLCFNEPTRGLTRSEVRRFRDRLDLARSRRQAVLVSIHNSQLPGHGCDRALLLDDGQLTRLW